jgi:23S rRNA (adenine2030-N6)-methyltransferase
MHGSGMFVINPPWSLYGMLQQTMPYLVSVLGQDEGASYALEKHEKNSKQGGGNG